MGRAMCRLVWRCVIRSNQGCAPFKREIFWDAFFRMGDGRRQTSWKDSRRDTFFDQNSSLLWFVFKPTLAKSPRFWFIDIVLYLARLNLPLYSPFSLRLGLIPFVLLWSLCAS
jgi:hypothetical protein